MLVITVVMYFSPDDWSVGMLYDNPFGRLAEFVLGIAIYRYYERYSSRPWSYTYGTLVEIAAVVLFVAVFIPHNLVRPRLRLSVYYWPSMIFLIYVFARSAGALSKALSSFLMVFLGEISFAFYMIHVRLGALLNGVNRRFLHMDQASLFYFLLYFFTTLGISIAVYLLFERPANQYLRRRLLQMPKARKLARA
jgi:peptidoglycan/LPS O-acetylase OafA/YrhL